MIQNIQTLSMRVDKIPVDSVINKSKRKLVWKPTKKCNQCDKKIKDKADFKFHKLETNEGKRYSCYQCDYEVTSKQSLKTHIEADHEGDEYQWCDDCNYQTGWKETLKYTVCDSYSKPNTK